MASGGASSSRRRFTILAACALAALAAQGPLAQPAEAQTPTRYSIAGGCFDLTSSSGGIAPGAAKLRLQATDLGSYLLLRPGGDFLAARLLDFVGGAAQPSAAADWVVEDASGFFTLSPKSAPEKLLSLSGGALRLVPRAGAGTSTRFGFSPVQGCAAFPEAELNATGTPARGATPYGEVRGLLDGHMHWMTFEYLGGNFHCGRPWHPYGIPSALPDCASIEGPLGAAAPFQNFLNYGSPVAPHDTAGWPTLKSWSRTNVTYEGTYYRWVQRAWMAGLRLIVMPVNENRILCELQVNRRNPCDEMTTVRQGIRDIEQLQRYVDAQAGGPGEGFFEIVRDPFEARRVINEGKLAVVLEVEISELFGCRGYSNPTCTASQIDSQLADLYDRGVRSSLLLNKFDSSLAGVRFDSGPVGALINAGNLLSAGSFWSAETCTGPERDNTIDGGVPDPGGFINTLLNTLGIPAGALPTYPPAPHCNTRGLTDLGAHTVREMIRRGMIVNPDHMSQRGVDATLSIAEQQGYSGVISPHSWMDPRNWPRIWALGGMAFPAAGSASGFVEDWRNQRPAQTPYYFGWGYGADLGGLATQGAPSPDPATRVTYPFKSLDGAVTVDRQRSGARVFDYANEGVAHYGLYADWAEEVRKIGGGNIVADMLRGPEGYLQMWERAVGIPASGCVERRARFKKSGLGGIRLGMTPRALLETAGQPLDRTRAWSYCVDGPRHDRTATTAVLAPNGEVVLIASTAPGHRVSGIRPGDPLAKVRRRARRIGGGVWISRRGKTRTAYLVRDKRIRLVAVAGQAAAGRKNLRRYMKLVPPPGRGAVPRPSRAELKKAPRVNERNALPLVQRRDPARFGLYCDLGL